MVYKSFRVRIVGRILFLVAMILLLIYLVAETQHYATILIVSLFNVYQIYSLVKYVESTNHDLTRFLRSIRYSDFSQTFFEEGKGQTFGELNDAFNEVIRDFRDARAEKEENFRYLQTVVQHIGIGLISFTPGGSVELINNAAKRLLNLSFLKDISDLEKVSGKLTKTLRELEAGENALVRVNVHGDMMFLVVYATELKMRGRNFKLVSLQNIRSELEEKELEAWQNLTRVLTHEIMNSITPIASLTATISDMLEEEVVPLGDGVSLPDETLDDVKGALQTINSRSQGLIHFVDAYRNFTRIPKPDFKHYPVVEQLERTRRLMLGEIQDSEVHIDIDVDPVTLEITADPKLIDQVLINLVKNALQAVREDGGSYVKISSSLDDSGRVIIKVRDDGPGIVEEAIEKIFIPFYSTKSSGSGIGLSLSRQIMRLHNGTLYVRSEPGKFTMFTLRF